MENNSITCLYSIYDSAAELFGPIYEAVNDAVAARNFSQVLLKVPDVSKPDFKLYNVGTFDAKTGEIMHLTDYKHGRLLNINNGEEK